MAVSVKSDGDAAAGKTAARRPRADALRNRERLIEAASEAFREGGLDVSVAEIARRAGVGSGTLFRNFPSKEDLVCAIIEARIGEWTVAAEDALADPDPASAFERFVLGAAEAQYRDRGLLEAFKEGMLDKPELFACKCQALDLSKDVLRRAQEAGVVRNDIDTDDLGNLVAAAVSAAERRNESVGDGSFERYIRITLDGLKPPRD